MNNKKTFLDTNIILDFLDTKRPNHKITQKLIKHLVLNGYTIFISEDMLSTIFYIDKDNQKVLKFFKTIIHKWEVISFGLTRIDEAIDLSIEKKLDLEDILQCLSARDNDCKILITQDKKFAHCGVRILTIEAFLEEIKHG